MRNTLFNPALGNHDNGSWVGRYFPSRAENRSYTVECKYPDGTVFDAYTATEEDGGAPGDTPRDLLDRARATPCGGCSSLSRERLDRVNELDAGCSESDSSRFWLHLLVNAFLFFGIPVFFILFLNRIVGKTFRDG